MIKEAKGNISGNIFLFQHLQILCEHKIRRCKNGFFCWIETSDTAYRNCNVVKHLEHPLIILLFLHDPGGFFAAHKSVCEKIIVLSEECPCHTGYQSTYIQFIFTAGNTAMKSNELCIYLLGRIEIIDHMVNSTAPGNA